MPSTADPSRLAAVAPRSSRPSSASCRVTTATKVLVMLPIPKSISDRTGVPVCRSAMPATPDQTTPSLVATAPAIPGIPSATLPSRRLWSSEAAPPRTSSEVLRGVQPARSRSPTSAGDHFIGASVVWVDGAVMPGRLLHRVSDFRRLTSLRFYCASNMRTASEAREPDAYRDSSNRLLERLDSYSKCNKPPDRTPQRS